MEIVKRNGVDETGSFSFDCLPTFVIQVTILGFFLSHQKDSIVSVVGAHFTTCAKSTVFLAYSQRVLRPGFITQFGPLVGLFACPGQAGTDGERDMNADPCPPGQQFTIFIFAYGSPDIVIHVFVSSIFDSMGLQLNRLESTVIQSTAAYFFSAISHRQHISPVLMICIGSFEVHLTY